MKTLTVSQIKKLLPEVVGWKRRGAALRRRWIFEDFRCAMKFVNEVARLAERRGHHPDITIRWNTVDLSLTSHEAGGLTRMDFQMAAQLSNLAPGSGPRSSRKKSG